jgi:hypothetical protein
MCQVMELQSLRSSSSRGAGARGGDEPPDQSVAGDSRAGCWTEIGAGMGDEERCRLPGP